MFILLSISFTSAAQNETQLTDDGEILTVTEDNLQTEETDEIISKINDNDNLTANVGTYTELEEAFKTNNEFTFEKDYAAKESDGVINIKHSIEIDGKGHTIDAGGFTGIFQSDSKEGNGITVTIKNLIFKNGVLLHGGAIYVDGPENIKYIIQNCTFINNTAWYEGGAIYFWGDGNILDISDSTFIKNQNHKDNGGGAIYLNAESTGIRNSIFENNLARSSAGGAINIDSKNTQGVLISNCIFNNNQVTAEYSRYEHRKGGAINYEGKSTLRVINSNFTNNQATLKTYVKIWNEQRYGGAISCTNRLELGGCNFINNSAVDRGGAVHADTLVWLNDYTPCTFINNSIKTWNHVAANKGGAIYASTFENIAYGLTFINNTGYYGGAIFINNKNDVTFQSCYFEGNTALTESKTQGSGAAIYVDSSGSTVTMVDNIFLNNKATSDNGILNCGKYGTIANNWWRTNNPNFNDAKYIVEWHRVGSNTVISDDRYLRAYINVTESQAGNSKLTVYFINNKGQAFTGKLTNWNVEFSSDKEGVFTDKQVGDNKATVSFTTNAIKETVTAKINNQILTINITQTEGDFAWLQKQIDAASGTLDLTRDVTYTIGLDTITDGIKIGNAITINGNGHKINAQGKSRIFDISDTNNVVFNNIIFMNGFADDYAGAIKMDRVNDVKILNSNFINNTAEDSSGAILFDKVIGLTISNCEFTNNKIDMYNGGAIRILGSENVIVEKSKFTNNTASQGGAIAISGDKNITIDDCEFRLNTAFKEGGAIYNGAEDVTVKNSIFLDNKANATDFEFKTNGTSLILALVGGTNYMNAIQSFESITFSNVTYWNGKITTDSNPVYSSNESGIKISLVIKDSQNRPIKNVILTTDANGQAVFNFDTLIDGKYTFNATHFEDSYYTQYSEDDEFTVSKVHTNSSEVKINIENGTEFTYGNVHIPFNVTNRTTVDVLITDEDESFYFEVNDTDLDHVIVDLPASDKDYYICIYNYANETVEGSADYKTFKIIKANSKVTVNPISDVNYGQNVAVSFEGDGTSYNVTVYDKNNNVAFTKIINEKSINISGLNAGEYNVTVVNLGNTNRTQSKNSTTFNVNKINNNIKVDVNNGTYGKEITVTVTADVDGDYTVSLNTRNITVYVENGKGRQTLDDLDAGDYTANVTFNNVNCNNNAVNTTFSIKKAQSHVEIVDLDENVAWNTTVSIRFSDFYPYKYNITIYDSGNKVIYTEISNSLLFTLPVLEVGQYNLTVANIGTDNVVGSTASFIFNVNKNNTVVVYAEDFEYGRDLLINIVADVDGIYTVDISGTQIPIEVVNGTGGYCGDDYLLNAGNYTTNVIFDNPDYVNNITNADFTVYPAESNIQIYPIDDVAYGDDVVVRFYDDYPTSYYIEVLDQNNKVVFDTTFKYEGDEQEMSIILADFDVGEYIVNIEGRGDDNIIGTSDSATFEVVDFEFDLDSETTGENTTLRVHVPANATGKIVVTVNGQNYTADVVNGTAVVTIPDLKDDDEILISFISDGAYPNKTQNTTNALINSKIVSSNMNRGYNSGMDFQATIVDGLNKPIANAKVTIIINGKRYTVVSDAKGLITVNQKFAVGTYLVTFINPFNNKVTSNSLKIVTRITGNKNVNTYYGKNYKYNLRIIGDNGNAVGAGVKVKVTINGKTKTLKTNKNGYITVKFTKTYLPKTYTVKAEYKGITVSNKIKVKKVLTLKKVKIKKSAKKLVLKATLKEGKKALKGKKVVFKFKGKKYTAKTNKKGIAKVTIKNKVLQKLKKGKKVKYQVTYLKHTVKRTAKVKR